MLLTVFLAVAVPICFLYVIHWLDLYGTDRPRIVVACFIWGLIAFVWSFVVNRFCIDILGLSRPFVATRTAPFVEEIFKAGILVYLFRRGQLTYFVDGAIYGFAAGIGFAVIENLRYIQLYPDNYFATIVLRDFSSALGHGTMTAMTGIALGGFVPSARRRGGFVALVAGWAAAMTLHYLWNNFAFFSTLDRFTTEWIFVGVALSGLSLVAGAILLGIHRERLGLRKTLGMSPRVSEEEANLVQHMDDLDRLLAPIERRFGSAKKEQVAAFLHLEARIGLEREILATTHDPELRAQLAAEIAEWERKINVERRNVGVYVMLYARSIFPLTSWSLWAHLAQRLSGRRPGVANLWQTLGERLGAGAVPAPGIYARLQSELDLRGHSAELTMQHVGELPEAIQKCMHWVMQEVHVTVEHAAASLGHHEEHAHAMLVDLVERGFLHHGLKDGQPAFRSRLTSPDQPARHVALWRSTPEAEATSGTAGVPT